VPLLTETTGVDNLMQYELKANTYLASDGGIVYDFGKKRISPNCGELLADPVWKDKLLDKWVYMVDDEDFPINIFFKHVFDGKRLYQIIYSGKDIYGDGLYKLYTAKILADPETDDIFIDPISFSLVYGAFTFPEGNGFIEKLQSDGFITQQEKDILTDRKASSEFARTLYEMKDHF